MFGDYPEIELEKQVSLKERAVSFFAFSNMFVDWDGGDLSSLGDGSENTGQVSFAVVDNSIFVRIEKTKELNRKFNVMLYMFGYNYKTPFATMPKICLITKYDRFKLFDGKKLIKNPQGLSLRLNSNALVLKVPLQLLGDPQFILVSLKARGGTLPIDATGFRKIEIK